MTTLSLGLQAEMCQNEVSFKPQVANTRPGGLNLALHLVSTRQQFCALASLLRSTYNYTVLKLHSAL